jgi:Domain of unknown function (DUF305)
MRVAFGIASHPACIPNVRRVAHNGIFIVKTPIPRTARTILSVVTALALSALCDSPAFTAGLQTAASDEAPFLAENDTAMTGMMDGMSVKPTGDVDRDFVAMMVPHHQGAIDMAQAELRYGHNEQLRRIAQDIVVEQQQEIIAMRVALGLVHSGRDSNATRASRRLALHAGILWVRCKHDISPRRA